MKEQKNIERLFQEKFKDFEVSAPETAWKNIELKLNEKKKKKRVIPFWFKASGVAASLLLGFYFYTFLTNSAIDVKKIKNNIVFEKENNSNINQNEIIDKNKSTNNNIIKQNNVLTEVDNSIDSRILMNNKENSGLYKKESETSIKIIENNDLLSNSKKNQDEKTIFNSNQVNPNKSISDKVILENSNKNNVEVINSNLDNTKIDYIKINKNLNDKNSSIIVDKSIINKTHDSSLVVKISEEVNTLEQLLKEKEVGKDVEEKEKEMQSKWVVSSNASPVYFNSTSKNSTLDTKFDANDKGYNSNISYGLGLSLALNKKISIRTGVNTLNFNSNTKDIIFYQRNNPVSIDNLSRNNRGELINIENKSNNNQKEIGLVGGELLKFNGELSQELGYLEIPLELSYKLIDKKFSIDIIGGMSTLFLNNNVVSLVSNDMDVEIGSATNLSTIHYSTNLGMGFSYTFFKSFQANINPMFKYQINTYTDNSNDIKPYFVGVYSGISFTF